MDDQNPPTDSSCPDGWIDTVESGRSWDGCGLHTVAHTDRCGGHTQVCRQMHTVIAGMLGAQQEGDGEDACVGLVGVITVAASIIPDIIRCTFGPDHARALLLVTQVPIFRIFQGISSQCHLRALDEYLSIVVGASEAKSSDVIEPSKIASNAIIRQSRCRSCQGELHH